MRAIVLRSFGAPAELTVAEVPEPSAGPGQVLVAAEYVNVTFIETQIRAGLFPGTPMTPKLPGILGTGAGGVVIAVGEGVDRQLVGRSVVARTGGSGGYAERIVANHSDALPVPENLPLSHAVAVMADGRTALALLRITPVAPGEVVLVTAAAGGVGTLLVQLCVAAGGRVIGLAGGEAKLEIARGFGAERAIDYSQPGWTTQLPDDANVAFDGVGGATGEALFESLRPRGRIHGFGAASGSLLDIPQERRSARSASVAVGIPLTHDELMELSAQALQLAADGRLKPVIGQTFALAEAAPAHAAIERRETVGKTLLRIAE